MSTRRGVPSTRAAQGVAAGATPRRRSLPRSDRLAAYLVFGAWTLFLLVALGWIVGASLSTTREIFTNDLLASGLHPENYVKALTTLHMARYLLNTLIYVTLAIILITVIAAPAAYVLSRYAFHGRGLLNMLVVAAQGIPAVMLSIPLFIVMIRVGLLGTTSGLVLIYVGTSLPFNIFFLSGFFSSLPVALKESALLDGCSEAQAFWRIMFPLAQPGLITVTIFNFVALWNEYFWALIFVNTPARRTLALGLEAVIQSMRYSGDWAGLFASIVIVLLPTVLLYVFLSEKIVGGITSGAIK